MEELLSALTSGNVTTWVTFLVSVLGSGGVLAIGKALIERSGAQHKLRFDDGVTIRRELRARIDVLEAKEIAYQEDIDQWRERFYEERQTRQMAENKYDLLMTRLRQSSIRGEDPSHPRLGDTTYDPESDDT